MKIEYFREKLNELAIHFQYRPEKSADKKMLLEEYYRMLQGIGEEEFARICDYLVKNYDNRLYKFPRVPDFNSARNSLYREPDLPRMKLDNTVLGGVSVITEISIFVVRMHHSRCEWDGETLPVKIGKMPDCGTWDIEEWEKAGFPRLWSIVLDDFYKGAIEPYKRGTKELIAYYRSFLAFLKEKYENLLIPEKSYAI